MWPVGVFGLVLLMAGANGDYWVGQGIADVTGPIGGIGMMGYANPSQQANGIHTRLWSRAFIFLDETTRERVVFVSVDIGMIDQAIKYKVVDELEARYPGFYTPSNVLLSGTHTHSGPSGYIQYALYGISSLGFLESNFNAIVTGIVESIGQAHQNMKHGKVYLNSGRVDGANINRSPLAYEENPADEIAMYKDTVDKDMILLRINDGATEPRGSINWFPVHPTSMNNTNKLVSGDNKGFAAFNFEKIMNQGKFPGKGNFVAAFASSNLGDVSPNTLGARCIDTGYPCDRNNTCNGFNQKCIAFGPGSNMEQSTLMIGLAQYNRAKEIFDTANTQGEELIGPIKHIHQYLNMTDIPIELEDGTTVHTCAGALGYSFAAGTVDGPGAFDFTQGTNTSNAFWDTIRDFLKVPSQKLIDCQKPKPILLAVGETHWPYEWTPSIVETQMLQIGNLFIVAIPGELTTMSGRRLKRLLEADLRNEGIIKPIVVVSGLANVYTHYITTPEEYNAQRYEGASTLYGKYTLNAYINQYGKMARAMLREEELEAGPAPPNLLDKQFSLIPPVLLDLPPFMSTFGDVTRQPYPLAQHGENVTAVFVSGHPRNAHMRGGSFLLVEFLSSTNKWVTVATDADWSTKMIWRRPFALSAESEVEITWTIPEDAELGYYRIRHFGYSRPALKDPKPYHGVTKPFKVKAKGMKAKLQRSEPETKKRLTVRDFWYSLFNNKRKSNINKH